MQILIDYISAHERLTSSKTLLNLIEIKSLQAEQADRLLEYSLKEIRQLKKFRNRLLLENIHLLVKQESILSWICKLINKKMRINNEDISA